MVPHLFHQLTESTTLTLSTLTLSNQKYKKSKSIRGKYLQREGEVKQNQHAITSSEKKNDKYKFDNSIEAKREMLNQLSIAYQPQPSPP